MLRNIAFNSASNYYVLNGFEASTIRLAGGTSSNGNNKVHLGDEIDVITSLADRWIDRELARLAVHGHIHEAVERARDAVWRDVVLA
jgi:hypothetical protein